MNTSAISERLPEIAARRSVRGGQVMRPEDIQIIKDGDGGPVYIYLQPDKEGEEGCVDRTLEIHSNVNVDVDENGNVIGIEVL